MGKLPTNKHMFLLFLRWTPRIVCILFAMFLSMFSFDVFEESAGFWKTIGAFLVHNIPAIVILVILLLSWKRPWIGGLGFLAAGIAYLFIFSGDNQYPVIYIPLFIIAILFFLDWFLRKKI